MNDPSANNPLILTAQLPPDLAAWATALRRKHFPPERNYLDAHVTLFHALPRFCEDELRGALAGLVSEYAAPPARLDGIMSLGGGTALRLTSDKLLDVRARIAERFHGLLTVQDQHTPRLHVTIQNKVSSQAAKALQTALEPQIQSRDFAFSGMALHIYGGGPWEFIRDWRFRGSVGG